MPDIRRNHGAGRHRGLTLTELVVAIALFVLVLGLLGFPLVSAFSYIQKAIAQSEVQAVGQKVAKQLREEIERAGYIFPIPPGGESISFIPSDESGAVFGSASAENYAALYRNYESANTVRFVRYGRVLDFPWVCDEAENSWYLLHPNDSEAGAEDRYERHHYPFYSANAETQRSNPYILARYQYQWDNLSFRSATVLALDASYPMSDYDLFGLSKHDQNVLTRLFRDDMVAVTPYGPDWDVSRFTVRPMRVTSEALQRPVAGSAVCTSVFSNYPLWAGRSRDLDEYPPNQLAAFYYPLVNTAAPILDPLADLRQFVDTEYPLYRLYPDTAAGPIPAAQNWRNPFGYQIRVYQDDGTLVCGLTKDSAECQRHYMEWPPIGRYDLASQNLAGEWIFDTSDPDVQQWRTDVLRQRAAGQVVFEQPVRIEHLPVTKEVIDDDDNYILFTAKLPVPDITWIDEMTYLVSPSPAIKVTDSKGNVKTFTLAKSGKAFINGTFYFPNLGGTNWYSGDTRIVQFRIGADEEETLDGGEWIVVNLSDNKPYRYTICDLQPTDTVVATYSTLGVLDLGMTLSRRDRSGRKLESARQTYTVNLRVEAKNAMRRARRW